MGMNQHQKRNADEVASRALLLQDQLAVIAAKAEAGVLKNGHLAWLVLLTWVGTLLDVTAPVDAEINRLGRRGRELLAVSRRVGDSHRSLR
jgi:hypothetical protein